MIHFFIKDDSDACFHKIKMEAWKEDKKVFYTDTSGEASSFQRVEELHLFSSIGEEFQTITFRIGFGKDSCTGTSARTFKDLKKEKTSDRFMNAFKVCSRTEYEKLRKKAIEIYSSKGCFDFDSLIPEGPYSIHQL